MKALHNLLLIVFLVFIGSLSALCQTDRIKEIYTENVISVYDFRHFIRNDQILKPKEVFPLFNNFEDSAFEFREFRKNRTTGKILMLPALGFIAAMFVTNEDPSLALGFGAAGVAFSITSGVFSRKATKHFYRSLYLYNRDIMVQQYNSTN